MKRYLIVGVALVMVLGACGGGTDTTTTAGGTETTSGATDTTAGATETTAGATETTAAAAGGMEDLIAAAQEEGTLTTIALPHDWCGYGAVIEGFKAAYGLEVNELDPGAGSAEELEAIDANRDNPGPQAPDVVDVGLAFGPQAKDAGLIQPYMVSTWDEIPDDAAEKMSHEHARVALRRIENQGDVRPPGIRIVDGGIDDLAENSDALAYREIVLV